MQNLLEDLSATSNIPLNLLQKLNQQSIWNICHGVEETILSGNNIATINIGIGTLYIGIIDDNIKYKFIPNTKLEDNLKTTILNNKCPLETKLEESFSNKIVKAYKDLF